MELQLQKQSVRCLRTALRELQTQEQTQEIRVSDGMPDIGSITGAWGQVILRGKEWEADSVRITGGTMVWVQYRSEDGEQTATVESWLPFQMQWRLPDSDRDGRLLCQTFLNSVDARSTSARKMMLRTGVSLLVEGLEPWEYALFSPEKLPEDVQLLTSKYPVELPLEAGEKAFALEEMLTPPPEAGAISELLSCSLQPEVTEEKLMGDKLVFRGRAQLHIHYDTEEGEQRSFDMELPFSQYCELDAEHDQAASVRLWPCVTAMEAELQPEGIHLKAGLVCQYRICGSSVLEVVEDAYSNRRQVECITQTQELPVILEFMRRSLWAKANFRGDGVRMADIRFLPRPVSVENREETAEITLSGLFQPLYYSVDGGLSSTDQQWTETLSIPLGADAVLEATVWPSGNVQGDLQSGSGQLQTQLQLHMETRRNTGIPMISALELGEIQEPDPNRPSLILKRAGERSLWELARSNGSTVERIRSANDLQGEPEQDRMLLIPVE